MQCLQHAPFHNILLHVHDGIQSDQRFDLTLCILTLHDLFSTWLLQLDKVPIWYTIPNFIDHIHNLLQCFCMLPSFMRELIRMIRACLDAMPVLKVNIWLLKTHILLQCTLITCQGICYKLV